MNTGTVIALIAGLAVLGVGGYLVYQSSQNKTVQQPPVSYPPQNSYSAPPPGQMNSNNSYDHTAQDWQMGVSVATDVIDTGMAIAEKFGAFGE